MPVNDEDLRRDFEAFMKENDRELASVARRYAGFSGLPEAAGKDIAQDALCIAWGAWEKELAGADCGRRLAFVYVAMSYKAREEQRSRRRAGELHDPSDMVNLEEKEASYEDRHLARSALRVLADAMAELPDEERLILDLAIACVPRGQIAAQLGLTGTNVTTKLHRAREKLRRSIGPDVLAELGIGRVRNPTGGAQ
ncbi:RNA polymerase sigma factor [Saccharopolyspora elongata]|uniref:Sigma-70 family RNA polymerase sigma factor n=1 Tax=Saccharopolyspora elongata TaxID=2530387 RepID=A0A4R4Z8F4_9PSEU|nr:sigma-70 family RNA polymerase sigma factor [Saccharopolyspora elongata]TDD53369.1 sigma-70 family RNA polymerase sigma factor [Saccharopolyspora elongata]